MIFSKTDRYYKRDLKAWKAADWKERRRETYVAVFRRETYWLLFIPVFTKSTIVAKSL